ncbi:Alpha-2C adrenergic receptor [Holothuria leucospilota]|uniref:Alpha-2C adrenergic receptor n=1 Tax=Holothuria leucospilota TaxID=206669 RepID=A0A9Q1C817_HOLLE|nr:Alpha-2C adrenergic receptor [Holothuria leucospilota]
MFCKEQEEWFANYSVENSYMYHRHTAYFVIEVSSLLVIMLVANFANFSVMVAILRTPGLRRCPHNVFVLNLVAMDLITSLGSMPLSFVDLFAPGYLLCLPALCGIHGVLSLFGCFGNFSAVILISICRCLGIVFFNTVEMKKRYLALMLTSGWLTAILLASPTISGDSSCVYTPGTHHCSPSWKDSCALYTIGVSFIYVITIPTMVICYVLITLKIKRSADMVESYVKKEQASSRLSLHLTPRGQTGELESDSPFPNERDEISNAEHSLGDTSQISSISQNIESEMRKQHLEMKFKSFVKKRGTQKMKNSFRRYDKRVAISGALLVLTTTVCWTPYFIVHSCRRETEPKHAVEVWSMWIAYVNSALDPIIYTMLNTKIRERVRQQCFIILSIIPRWNH